MRAPPAQNTARTTMAHLFRYRVFGLVMVADIPLDKLQPDASDESPSIILESAPIDPNDFAARDQGLLWKTAPMSFQISVPDIATLRVRDGQHITLDTASGADQKQVQTLVLSAGIGALLQQRGTLALHAAAFETQLGAVALAGVSGSGKSLLLAALNARGYPVICDDITATAATDTGPWVRPAWPVLSLMPDTFATLGLDCPAPAAAQQQGKRDLPASHFCAQQTPLAKIIFLNWTPDTDVSMAELKGADTLSRLSNNVYRRTFLKGMGRLDRHFDALTRVAAQTRCITLTRPHDLGAIPRVLDTMEDSLGICPPVPQTPDRPAHRGGTP